jgi:putative peptidoglycan lipid II flippase
MSSTTDHSAPVRRARLGVFLNTLIVAGGYLLSRVLGLIRTMIFSSQFGTQPEFDAYQAAFKIPDLIYLVIAGGALGSAFIPVFAALLTKEREDDAWRLASGVLNTALVALVVVSTLIALLADPLARLIAPGFDAEQQALTADLMRLLLIQPILLGIGGLAKATLESFDQFALPAIGANLYNLGIIGGALFLAPRLGIFGLVWGVIVGAALFLMVQLPGLWRAGMRYTPVFGLRTPEVRQIGKLLGPRLLGQSAFQINLIVITVFATLTGSGAVAANDYAFQLMVLPHGLIALSLGTVIFPQLARHYAAGDNDALRTTSLGAIRNVLFLSLPAAVLLGVLGLPIVRLLLQRNAFTAESATLTADALTSYAIGLAAFAAAEIIVRTFYATQDTFTPVMVGIGAVIINIALAWVLLPLGIGGLALAFSIATILEALILLILLPRRIGAPAGSFFLSVAKMVIATLLFGVTLLAALWFSSEALAFLRPGDTYRWPADFLPLALWLAGVSVGSGVMYLGSARLLRLDEVTVTIARLRRRG